MEYPTDFGRNANLKLRISHAKTALMAQVVFGDSNKLKAEREGLQQRISVLKKQNEELIKLRTLEDRGLSGKSSIFVIGWRRLFPKHARIKKEALCASSIWKRRKFSNCILRWHSGSHAIAWAAITTSVCKVSYDLQIKTWHSWLTFSVTSKLTFLGSQ